MNGGSLGRYGSYSSGPDLGRAARTCTACATPIDTSRHRELQARRDVRRELRRDARPAAPGPTYQPGAGPRAGRRQGHRHRPALQRHRRHPRRPVDPDPPRHRRGPRRRHRPRRSSRNDLVDHDFLATYCIGYDEDTMPESAQGQNKSYKSYIMGLGADGVEKTPAWAEAITGIPARDHLRPGPGDRHHQAVLHLAGQGPAAPEQRRADRPRHLHAAHPDRQRGHQRRQHRQRPEQLLLLVVLAAHRQQPRRDLDRDVHLDRLPSTTAPR